MSCRWENVLIFSLIYCVVVIHSKHVVNKHERRKNTTFSLVLRVYRQVFCSVELCSIWNALKPVMWMLSLSCKRFECSVVQMVHALMVSMGCWMKCLHYGVPPAIILLFNLWSFRLKYCFGLVWFLRSGVQLHRLVHFLKNISNGNMANFIFMNYIGAFMKLIKVGFVF